MERCDLDMLSTALVVGRVPRVRLTDDNVLQQEPIQYVKVVQDLDLLGWPDGLV
jgi:hypothetical protein